MRGRVESRLQSYPKAGPPREVCQSPSSRGAARLASAPMTQV